MEHLEMMISWLPCDSEMLLDLLHISDSSHFSCELSHAFIHDLSNIETVSLS